MTIPGDPATDGAAEASGPSPPGPAEAPGPSPPGPAEAPGPSPPGAATEASGPSPLRAAVGIATGFSLLALTNSVAIVASVPLPAAGLRLRLAHLGFDLAQTVGIGIVVGAIVGGGARLLGRRLVPALCVYALGSAAVMHWIVGQDLQRQALVALNGKLMVPLYWALVVLSGMAIPAAHLLAAFFRRFRRLFVAPLILAAGGVITHHLVVRDDYPGLHCAIAWTAATLAGVTLAPRALRWIRSGLARRPIAVALYALALAGVLGVVVSPPNRVRIELFREPGAVAAWVLAGAVWSMPAPPVAPPPASPWFADRTALLPVPPTVPPLLAGNPVVVMVTIDATRGDVIEDPANARLFPVITRLKRSGAYFPHATSPGSQTAVSLTATFSGRYFSELYWGMHGEGASRFAYAADDPAPRFPALLTARGVTTSSFCSLNFLAGHFGVIRGFSEEQLVPEGRKHAYAKQMVDPVLERLRKVGPTEPLFLYTHLMEPHAPYDRGTLKTGTDKERYLSEIAVADAELGRIARILEQRFKDRGYLIVGADHGEAFGEHGTVNHTKTLYEELLRVPLIIRGPGVVARTVEQHVGLVDLGPTILDSFGVETPADFKGQSLVPLLAGGDVTLDRPLVAEGRLRRALYWDGLKVIEDQRRKVVEVYDLAADPGELRSLFDEQPERAALAIAALRAFFGAHALVRPGYSPPYKP